MSARASGLMEATELYHAETITLPLRLATYEELRYQHKLAEPRKLARMVDSRFHPNLRLLWAEGRNLLNDETVLVPYETVHTNFTIPSPEGHGCFNATSNGLASGNHLLEAITHGLCELVERDATTLWKFRGEERLTIGRVDLSSITDPTCQELLSKFEVANTKVGIWNVTTEINLPVFVCYLLEGEGNESWYSAKVAAGFGCHPSRAVALTRDLTEAAQSRLTIVSGSRDDFGNEAYDPCSDQSLLEAIATAADAQVHTNFHDVPNFEGDTLEADLEWELRCVKNAGFDQVIVVDLSRKEFGIPVVRVIVPGLEAMIVPGYVPGQRGQAILEVPT